MPKAKMPTLEGQSRRAWTEVERYRKEHNLTAKELAETLGISAGAFRGWCSRVEMPASLWNRFTALVEREQGLAGWKASSRGVYLPDVYWDTVRQLGNGNISAGVRRLVEQHRRERT